MRLSGKHSLPFTGRAGVGMGANMLTKLPIPLLTSPLKGEERELRKISINQ